MTLITKDMVLEDNDSRRAAYRVLDAHADMVRGRRGGNGNRYRNASRTYVRNRAILFDSVIKGLGRSPNIINDTIGPLNALIRWIKWVFATSTTLGGAVILLIIVIIGMSYGLFKQYDCLHIWEKSDFAITAKITAGLGDGTEAVFLVILDHLKTNRMLLGGTG